jgi:hypothetical protein
LEILACIIDCAAHRIALLTPGEIVDFADIESRYQHPEMEIDDWRVFNGALGNV